MDDFFNPSSGGAAEDPASDFLRREQEALGSDAAAFGGGASGAGGFDKDFASGASAFPDLEDDDDALGGFVGSGAPTNGVGHAAAPNVNVTANDDLAQFEEEYPEIEMPSAAPAQNNGFAPAPTYNQPTSLFSGTPAPVQEESEFIKGWKVKQAEEIAKREEESSRKKEETIAKAQNAIDNFYKEYNSKKEKNIAKNKEEEAKFNADRTDALAKGTTWERICTLVELQDSRSKTSSKSKQDLARFKEVLLSLKREGESAPGAAGY